MLSGKDIIHARNAFKSGDNNNASNIASKTVCSPARQIKTSEFFSIKETFVFGSVSSLITNPLRIFNVSKISTALLSVKTAIITPSFGE